MSKIKGFMAAIIASAVCLSFSGCAENRSEGVNEPPTSREPTWNEKNRLSRGDKNFDDETETSLTTEITTLLSETSEATAPPETTPVPTEPETAPETEAATTEATTTTTPPETTTTTAPATTTTAPPTTAATTTPAATTAATTTTTAATTKVTTAEATTVTTTTPPETATTTAATTAKPVPFKAKLANVEWSDNSKAVSFDLTFEGVTDESYAWIGIFKVGDPGEEQLAINKTAAKKNLAIMTSGNRDSLSASLEKGNYELRVYEKKGGPSVCMQMFIVGSDKMISDGGNSGGSGGIFDISGFGGNGGNSGGGSGGGSCISCGKPIYSGNYCRYHYEEDQWIAGNRPTRPNPADYP